MKEKNGFKILPDFRNAWNFWKFQIVTTKKLIQNSTITPFIIILASIPRSILHTIYQKQTKRIITNLINKKCIVPSFSFTIQHFFQCSRYFYNPCQNIQNCNNKKNLIKIHFYDIFHKIISGQISNQTNLIIKKFQFGVSYLV